MPIDVIMPSLGFDMKEGTLSRWLVKEGERVEKGQAIAEIETEKATVEIEAAVSGAITRIAVEAGRTVPVGTVIGTIGAAGEKAPEKKAPPPASPDSGAPAEAPPAEAPPAASAAPPAPEAPSEKPPAAPPAAEPAPAGERVKASPVARKKAEESGIDLSGVKGSGPGGRILERDVEAAIAAEGTAAPAAPPAADSAAPAVQAGETVALNRIRQATARRMVESKTTAPHFYVTVEIDMDEATRMREQLNRIAPADGKVSVNDFVVAAAARALARYPSLNASWRDGSVEIHPRVNIGIAVALEDGLITPVLRDADGKTLKAIAAESKALAERARSGKLRPEDVGFGTFTVSNLGMFDVDEFTAIINPPEAAILAVGAVVRRPVAAGDGVRVAAVMKATLSVDHRVADGAQAGRFLQELRKLLENPVNLLTG
ncbi:MAG: dihydrolipoamide acetyltransferase family protein [Thermodesulfobacteriota bacterium]